MNNYELVAVISPEVDEEGVVEVLEKMNRFIGNNSGVAGETERWGIKKLAYPLKRFMEGNYILTRFTLAPEFVKELETEIKASGEVLRHLVVKVGD